MIFTPLESPVSQLENEVKNVENGTESISRYDAYLSALSVQIPPYFHAVFRTPEGLGWPMGKWVNFRAFFGNIYDMNLDDFFCQIVEGIRTFRYISVSRHVKFVYSEGLGWLSI